ncbi:Vegetative incompatibility protein HET-E-1 [Rhizoctonia solani AG-1 IB]|uniref:Vegetative incompatibility protein HET-E-1 n=1 Tax=Thanatephorus cucumeris (strain AG1-IB / isolate 7/3/14) TaxID=1108050 RepID=M5CAM9_THACB|nr:Vegetative incompatibility protein HET-E-1 [Rhizoctonia solani AG-1 IB]
MPFIMTLRESLARSKDKWKQRWGIGSEGISRSPSALGTRSGSPPPHEPTDLTLIVSGSAQTQNQSTGPHHASTVKDRPSRESSARNAVEALLTALEAGAESFGPAKPVVTALRLFVDTYMSPRQESEEYADLAVKLKDILADLDKHMKEPIGLVMTNCVKRIYSDIEQEVKMVTEKQAEIKERRLISTIKESDEILECYHRIDGHFQRLTLNASMNTLKAVNEQTAVRATTARWGLSLLSEKEVRLTRMSPSMSAVYNSAESQDIKRGGCARGTREPQIKLLLDWASTPKAGRACWMNGMAGTGKTTIAHTVCSRLDESCKLGASFFCSRVIPECRQAKYIIPSIAYQLARFSAPFRQALDRVLELDPDAHTRSLEVQFKKLIVGTLLEVKKSLPVDFIVVIDALDECENEDTVGQILDLILSSDNVLPIRFLLSSRPEREITQRMSERAEDQNEAQLVLHDLDSDAVKADIEAYMRHELRYIPLKDTQWHGIIASCGVLFIYASTTCRYIEDAHRMDTLDEAVSSVVSSVSSSMAQAGPNAIDKLYETILSNAFGNPKIFQGNRERMMQLLETVICAIEPMTMDTLANLLEFRSIKQVEGLLKPLRSVLNVTQATGLVTTLHASFPDFMLSHDRSRSFYCQPLVRHAAMAGACLRIIEENESKFNICALPSSYNFDNEVPDFDTHVSKSISPALIYGCRYWSTHLRLGEYRVDFIEFVRNFFSTRLLLWMEILNLTKHIRYGPTIVQDAENWCIKRNMPEDLIKLVHDAWQFVSFYAHHPLSQSTPHIYVSMLPFLAFISAYLDCIHAQDIQCPTWQVSTSFEGVPSIDLTSDGTQLVATAGDSIEVLDTATGESVLSISNERTSNVMRVAISPDGTKLAFSGLRSTLRVCNISNRDAITEPLPDSTLVVSSIAFSRDGSYIACGMENGDVYIYGLQQEARSRGPLQGHTGIVRSVSFPPNSLYLVSGSDDRTVRMWNVQTGELVREPFQGHTASISSVSFSPDGSRLASASEDQTIRVWDPERGRALLEPFRGHSGAVYSVAYSPNSAFLASGSEDKTIIVYNAETGRIVHGPLPGHTRHVNSVIFYPDSTRLFSCSGDGTVRVWNLQDLKAQEVMSPASTLTRSISSIRYSRTGLRVASGSQNGEVHVWDVQTGNMVLGPLRGHQQDAVSVDYSPDDAYIASGSYDKTLRIWDAANGQDTHGPMRGHDGRVNCVRFSPDSSVVVSGSDDRTVRIWDVGTRQQLTELFRGDDPIQSVGISPDGQRVVSGSLYGYVQVLDRNTGATLLGPIKAHYYLVHSVDFSPNGMRLISGSHKLVTIHDAQTGRRVRYAGHDFGNKLVYSVSFSPNGLYVVSCSLDRTVCVWDAQNGNLILGPLKGHTSEVTDVQFSPDGSHIVSCSRDRTIRFWDVSRIEVKLQQRAAMGVDHGEDASARPHGENMSDWWSLDNDGWLLDPYDRRLLWVPSDLRTYLALPPASLLITDQGSFQIGTDGWKYGDVWADCYCP